MFEVVFTSQAKEDLEYWKDKNPKILNRIDQLIENIKQTSFTGIGKPEPLKHERSGFWSRRIDSEHRLVYKLYEKIIFIAQCRFHY